MGKTRHMEPILKSLFDIVKQDLGKNEEQSRRIDMAQAYIKEIKLLEKSGKEGNFDNISLDTWDENGATFLIWASVKGHTAIVGMLLEDKANPNLANRKTGQTPLICACREGDQPIAYDLLEHEASPDLANEISGETPLIYASHEGHATIVHDLLEYKANPNLANAVSGGTPLTYATSKGYVAITHDLLKHNANPNLASVVLGRTPLNYASDGGYAEIVRDLLEHKADPDLANVTIGGTPLIYASQKGYETIVSDLLKYGANPNLADTITGITPLLAASRKGHRSVACLLLDAEAKVDLLVRGKSVLEVALSRKDFEMIVVLLRYDASIRFPKLLFDFLMACDPREPDVLFALQTLQSQQNRLKALKVVDANIQALDKKQLQELDKYCKLLSQASEQFQVKHELLDSALKRAFPTSIVDMIRGYDNTPLYRLNNSDTLFRDSEQKKVCNRKQADQLREELTKKYKGSFSIRKWF